MRNDVLVMLGSALLLLGLYAVVENMSCQDCRRGQTANTASEDTADGD